MQSKAGASRCLLAGGCTHIRGTYSASLRQLQRRLPPPCRLPAGTPVVIRQ